MNKILFSVILPTYNRREQLIRCLSSIAVCSFDRDRFEIIVVNDGGAAIDDIALDPQFAFVPLRNCIAAERRPRGSAQFWLGYCAWPLASLHR